MRLFNKKFVGFALAIFLFSSSLSYGPPDRTTDPDFISASEPITVTLTYEGEDKKQKKSEQAEDSYGEDVGSETIKDRKYGGDGAAGHLQKKVTERMDQKQTSSGTSSKKTDPNTSSIDKKDDKLPSATLTVNITPELRRISLVIDSISVEININNHQLQTSDMDEKIKQELRLEADNFVKALDKWYKRLSKDEKNKLRSGERLLVDVNEPYQKLNKFKGDRLTIPVLWKRREETVDLNFVQRYKDGFLEIYRIPRGEPFWVEASFSEKPKDKYKTVIMSWGTRQINVRVERTKEMSTLYRSLPFVIESLKKKSTYKNN